MQELEGKTMPQEDAPWLQSVIRIGSVKAGQLDKTPTWTATTEDVTVDLPTHCLFETLDRPEDLPTIGGNMGPPANNLSCTC